MKCQTVICDSEALCAFRWPGRSVQPACFFCYSRARAIAHVMGFELDPLDIEVVLRPLAVEAVELVRSSGGT